MNKEKKIHLTVTEDYITSYENSPVQFCKGDVIWGYEYNIIEDTDEGKIILAHDEVFGHIEGFIPLSKTDYGDK